MSEEVGPEVIKKTQKLLGKYVKKPPLTEKLLKKPPFRFLQDVIGSVIRDTGFLRGLYSDEELKSDNAKDKEAKIAFLNKLIEAVKTLTKSDLAVRSGKIVAGLEPTNTNLLLQAIGKALDAKIDSTDYIARLGSKPDPKKPDATKPVKQQRKTKTKEEPKPTKIKIKEDVPSSKRSTPKESSPRSVSNNKDSSVIKSTNKKVTPKESPKGKVIKGSKEPKVLNNKEPDERVIEVAEKGQAEEITNKDVVPKENATDEDEIKVKQETNELQQDPEPEKVVEEKKKVEEVVESNNRSNLVRPKSARPKSGDRERNNTEISRHEGRKGSANDRVGSSKGDSTKPIEMTMRAPSHRPKSSLRPPSVRPSSARPGAPRLRPDSALAPHEPVLMGNVNVIVENVDGADEEEDVPLVVVESAPETDDYDEGAPAEAQLLNKGHLVEQILEKIHEGEAGEQGMKRGVDVEREPNAQHGREEAKELSQLRTFIQNITKTANPLGKLLNYLHEDIDAMHSELQMWTHTKKQLFAEIQRQQRLSAERDKPLLSQLHQLKQEIAKQQQEIVNVQSNILRNDLRIKELISKQLNVN